MKAGFHPLPPLPQGEGWGEGGYLPFVHCVRFATQCTGSWLRDRLVGDSNARSPSSQPSQVMS